MILVNYSKVKNLSIDKIAKIALICDTLNKLKISISYALKNNFGIPLCMTMSKAKNYLIDNTVNIPL